MAHKERKIVNVSQARKLPVGTVMAESDGAIIRKNKDQKWMEFFIDGTEDFGFRSKEIAFPAYVIRRGV